MPRIKSLDPAAPNDRQAIRQRSSTKRILTLFVLLGIALAVAVVVYLLFTPKGAEELVPHPLPPSSVSKAPPLVVSADPQSAQVQVRLAAGSFTDDLSNLPAGRHMLRVSNPGFVTHQQVIEIDEGKVSQSLEITLSPMENGLDFRDPGSRDGTFHGPLMVVIPKISFRMGYVTGQLASRGTDMYPARSVQGKTGYAISKAEITVSQFQQFVSETNYPTHAERIIASGGEGCTRSRVIDSPFDDLQWRKPGFDQTPSHPVTCISWGDASEFAAWLSRRTGERYRLPSEAEWEFAARAYTATKTGKQRFYFGERSDRLCQHGNVSGTDGLIGSISFETIDCSDGFVFTSPAQSFKSNAFGLNDVIGNVSEWVQDCYQPTYSDAPVDGGALEMSNCQRRVFRGGSWSTGLAKNHELQLRHSLPPQTSLNTVGFRVVRDLVAPK